MQQPGPALEADIGALQLQPHLAHGAGRRHPDPAADGLADDARDGGAGGGRRVTVLAELGLAGVVAAAESQVHVAEPSAAHGLQTAPEISQPQRGELPPNSWVCRVPRSLSLWFSGRNRVDRDVWWCY